MGTTGEVRIRMYVSYVDAEEPGVFVLTAPIEN